MTDKVGIPTASGLGNSLTDFAIGGAGALTFGVVRNVLDLGWLGGLLAAVGAGAVVKGTRGTVIATILGFQSLLELDPLGGASPENEREEII